MLSLDVFLASTVLKRAARVPLNRISCVEYGGILHYRKGRRWYARPLIRAAEWILTPRFRVLPVAEWHARATHLYQAAYGLEVVAEGHALWVPALPGEPVAMLIHAGRDPQLRAVASAARALRALHALPTPDGRGGSSPFSHGDATVHNVVYDAQRDTARWFDFETAHRAGQTTHWRHADDLRALAFSAGGLLPEAKLPALVASLVQAYPDPAVLAALRGILRQLRAHPDPLHLAQADMTAAAYTRLDRQLEAALA